MNYKQVAYTLFFALASTLTQAQVKIGKNPTTITLGALLDIEGGATTTRTVSLTNGNFGIMTDSPIRTLDVNGDAGVRNNHFLEFGLGVAGKLSGAGTMGYGLFTPNALDIIGGGTVYPNRAVKLWDNVLINGSGYLEFGHLVTGKHFNAGKIGYGVFTSGVLDIVGAGTADGNRAIKLWDKVKIGGGAAPTSSLDVEGNVRIADGTQGAAKIFTSDANGYGSWKSPQEQTTPVQVKLILPQTQSGLSGSGTYNQLNFSAANFDVSGNSSGNRVTIPSFGLYDIQGNINFSIPTASRTGGWGFGVFVNSTFFALAGDNIEPNVGTRGFGRVLLRLNAGDVIYPAFFSQQTDGNGTTVFGGDYSVIKLSN